MHRHGAARHINLAVARNPFLIATESVSEERCMSRSRLKPLLIACIGLTLCTAIGIENLSIDRLVSASDLIAIADVLDVSDAGPAPPLVFRGQKLSAEAYNVELTVTDIIKGSATGRVLVKYALPASFVGYQGLHRGVRLVFLRKGTRATRSPIPITQIFRRLGWLPKAIRARAGRLCSLGCARNVSRHCF